VGLITGLGEAVALVLRLGTGPIADRTRRYWPITVAGYAITIVATPLLAFAAQLWQAAALIIAERFGKAVRTPARDTLLAHAGTRMGRGKAFAVHEALDQSGALIGPLLIGAVVASAGYQAGFAALAVPGAVAMVAVVALRRLAPHPEEFGAPAAEDGEITLEDPKGLPPRFWWYAAFTSVAMLGFPTFGVLSYHLEARSVLAPGLIPVAYAVAMAAAAVVALVSGAFYDRLGLRILPAALVLAAAVPFLSFSLSASLVWIGAAVWGAAMGLHESTMRAAVADLVSDSRRATAYGVFTACYGLAWLAGSVLIGWAYQSAPTLLPAIAVGSQAAALVLFAPVLRSR
jgi:MFS family permease